jgi:hypothetical protein
MFSVRKVLDSAAELLYGKGGRPTKTKPSLAYRLGRGVRHLREFRDLNVHSSTRYYLQQWPWIYATIASMENYNMDLANCRLQHFFPVINMMEKRGIPEVLDFKAPTNFENGEKWILPDFPKWHTIFGDIVSF